MTGEVADEDEVEDEVKDEDEVEWETRSVHGQEYLGSGRQQMVTAEIWFRPLPLILYYWTVAEIIAVYIRTSTASWSTVNINRHDQSPVPSVPIKCTHNCTYQISWPTFRINCQYQRPTSNINITSIIKRQYQSSISVVDIIVQPDCFSNETNQIIPDDHNGQSATLCSPCSIAGFRLDPLTHNSVMSVLDISWRSSIGWM